MISLGDLMKKFLYLGVLLSVMFSAYLSPYIYLNIRNCFQEYVPDLSSFESYQEKSIRVVLQDGDYVYFGTYLNEPVIWKVASIERDKKVLLISEKILCFKAFDARSKCDNSSSSDTKLFGSSQWESCTLKKWLNSSEKTVACCTASSGKKSNIYEGEFGFLHNDNFSKKQREMISDEGIFLPSSEMLQKYLNENELKKKSTKSAVSHNNSQFIILPEKSVWYWTGSKINKSNVGVVAVTSSGSFYKSLAIDSSMGVCPALYLKTNNVYVSKGNGIFSQPYIIEK